MRLGISGLSLIQVLTSTALPSWRLGQESPCLPLGGCRGRRLKAVFISACPWGRRLSVGFCDTLGVGNASPQGEETGPMPTTQGVLLNYSFNQHLPSEHLLKEGEAWWGAGPGAEVKFKENTERVQASRVESCCSRLEKSQMLLSPRL